MSERVRKVLQSIDRLSLRERLFLLSAVLVVLGGLWEAVLAAPLSAREHVASEKITALKQRLDQLNDSVEVAAAGMSEGMPNQLDRLRLLRERVAEGEEAVRIYTSDLIDPKQMRLVLEELIRKQKGLTLISASNLAVQPLFETAQDEDGGPLAAGPSEGAPKLYEHTLALTLRGSYLDCLTYLETVERLPWHLYWAHMDFAVDSYPLNTIVIELKTLSLEEEWIGV
jgi:MSHA biogenesis protein MshJ